MAKYKVDREYIIPLLKWNDIFSIMLIERKSIYDFLTKTVIRLYGSDIRNEKIMDFGCGQSPYYCLFQAKRYVGVDVEESGHSNNEKNADVYYNGNLPFSNDAFKYILATQCLEHIAETDKILKELCRVLKKGGKLIITVPMVWVDHELPFDYYRFTEQGIKNRLEKNGFRIIYIRKLNGMEDAISQLKILAICRKNCSVMQKKIRIAFENLKYIDRYKRKGRGGEQDKSLSTCIGLIAEKIVS